MDKMVQEELPSEKQRQVRVTNPPPPQPIREVPTKESCDHINEDHAMGDTEITVNEEPIPSPGSMDKSVSCCNFCLNTIRRNHRYNLFIPFWQMH